MKTLSILPFSSPPLLSLSLFLIISFTLLPIISDAWAATYYVDATNGNDTNNGLSTATAWKTIAKVNASSFSAGDSILFKKGCTWKEGLVVPSSGGVENPITFGAYGSGDNPIFDGSDAVTGWTLTSVSATKTLIYQASCAWTPRQVLEAGKFLTLVTWNTDIATTGASMSPGTWTLDDANHVLYVWATDGANPDTHVMDVSRRANAIIGTGGNKHYISIDSIEVKNTNDHAIDANGNNNWTITNVVAHGAYKKGISFNGSTNTTISYCTAYNNSASDGGYAGIGTSGATTALISHCTIYSNNLGDSGDGIQIATSTAITIEYNHIYDQANGGSADGIQINASTATIRYNIVHDCRDGVIFTDGGHGDVYYNLFYNNTYGIYFWQCGGGNTTAYNNVLYQNNTGNAVRFTTITSPYTVTFKNNIVYNAGAGYSLYEAATTDGTLLILNYNLYYAGTGSFIGWEGTDYSLAQSANYRSTSGQDAHSLNSDPQFADIAKQDYRLKPTSPCIDAGTDVHLAIDLAGTSIPKGTGVDIGAFEYETVAPPQNIRFISTP